MPSSLRAFRAVEKQSVNAIKKIDNRFKEPPRNASQDCGKLDCARGGW
jgi:hypothetical protein